MSNSHQNHASANFRDPSDLSRIIRTSLNVACSDRPRILISSTIPYQVCTHSDFVCHSTFMHNSAVAPHSTSMCHLTNISFHVSFDLHVSFGLRAHSTFMHQLANISIQPSCAIQFSCTHSLHAHLAFMHQLRPLSSFDFHVHSSFMVI